MLTCLKAIVGTACCLGCVCSLSLVHAEQIDLSALQQEVADLSVESMDDLQRQRLIAIDDTLSQQHSADVSALRETILIQLAKTEQQDALQYVRRIFENDPEHRDEAAYALSQYAKQRPVNLQDWRFLVRSLTVVENEAATAVMQALSRYRQRATNSRWVRWVILIGLKGSNETQVAANALLKHWTGVALDQADSTAQQTLTAYQNWFRDQWPEELDPSWPMQPEQAKWTWDTLWSQLAYQQWSEAEIEAGKAVYERANCAKCHKKGPLGENRGPDLSDITAFRQRREILQAILFPNLELNEDYPTVVVVTTDGKVLTGLMSAVGSEKVRITDQNGKQTDLTRNEIEEFRTADQSNMPAGALETLSLEEIRQLLAFIEQRTHPEKPYHSRP